MKLIHASAIMATGKLCQELLSIQGSIMKQKTSHHDSQMEGPTFKFITA